jgi:reactive intermediate/imine deaminase
LTETTARRVAVQLGPDAPAPLGAYSHAVWAGNLLFVSGQGAREAETGREAGVNLDGQGNVESYDIEVQTRAVLNNLKFVLQASGCSMEDLVDVSVFLKDMSDFQKYNRVYAEFMNFENPPARTTVAVKDLPGKNFIEIKAIAFQAHQ